MCIDFLFIYFFEMACPEAARAAQVSALERWNPGQHVVTESLSGAIVTQTIICHGPSHPKLPQPSPGKHTGVAEFVFNGAAPPPAARMNPLNGHPIA